MKIALFFPFGSSHSEVNAAHLLALTASNYKSEVSNITCNGALSLCDRDKNTDWQRSNTACFHCQCGQSYVNSFTNFESKELSKYITADFSKTSKVWIESLSSKDLLNASIDNLPLTSICSSAFKSKYNKLLSSETLASNEEHYLRRFIINSLRVYYGIKNYISEHKPDLIILSGKDNFVSNAARLSAANLNTTTISISAEPESKEVLLRNSKKSETLLAEINVESLVTIRKSVSTWPDEFMNRFYPALYFIGIDARQMALPIQNLG